MSWDDDFLGARASRPHPVPAKASSRAGASGLSTLQAASSVRRLAAAELQCDSAGSNPVVGHHISQAEGEQWCRSPLIEVGELGEAVPGLVRAGRPRSQAITPPLRGESQKPSRQAMADAVGGGNRALGGKPVGPRRTPELTRPGKNVTFLRLCRTVQGLWSPWPGAEMEQAPEVIDRTGRLGISGP